MRVWKKEVFPLQDPIWGDRDGKLTDPYGHHWLVATHIKDVEPEEMTRRSAEAMKAVEYGAQGK